VFNAGVVGPSALLPQAVEHGDLAVELDPAGARGWYALARAEVLWTRDWSRAEMHYRRALALDPTAREPAYRLAELLAALGRTREALDQSGLALALGPTTPALNTSAGIVHYYTGDHAEGLHRFATALAEGGREADVAVWVARARAALGLSTEAQAIAQKAGGPEARPSWVVGYVHAIAGRRTEAERVLAAMGERSTRAYVPALEFAYVWAALGESDKALGFIETAVQERSPGLEWLLVEPLFSKLRAEPRFRAAGAAMKLGPVR
jgi:eukaryotic-like serine/threonine-protein kinase